MLVCLDLIDDVISNEILSLAHLFIERDMLDGEVIEIDGIVNRKGNDGSVIISKDGGDTEVQSLSLSDVSVAIKDRKIGKGSDHCRGHGQLKLR